MGADMDAALQVYQRRGAFRRKLVAGGSLALLAMLGGYHVLPFVELGLAQPQEYAVAAGKIRKVRLADGTQLILAGGADVKVRYTRHDRIVELARGTIFVDVAHDEDRPFRVNAGNARIVDIGTSFEVSSKPANIRVAVASGVVNFGKAGWFDTPVSLTARQAAVLNQAGLKRITDVNDVSDVARWRSEWVEYQDTPLRQVVSDLQTLSPLPIEIADESLANRPVGGRIRLTDPVIQLENLAIIYDFKVRKANNMLVIGKR